MFAYVIKNINSHKSVYMYIYTHTHYLCIHTHTHTHIIYCFLLRQLLTGISALSSEPIENSLSIMDLICFNVPALEENMMGSM